MVQTPTPDRAGRRARAAAALRRFPSELVFPVVVLVVLVAFFFGLVLPLLRGGATLTAEIAGETPASAPAGQPVTLDLALDNTGARVISPLCVEVGHDTALDVVSVEFQGLDRVPFRSGRACAGQLTGQETVNVQLTMVPRQPGLLHLTLAPAQGTQRIGPVVHRTILISG